MAGPTKLTGVNGVVSVNTVEVAVADFKMDIKRGTATQKRCGKYSDRKIAGKVEVSGSLTNLDIMGDHIGRLLNTGTAAMTKTVINACDLATAWTALIGTTVADETTIIKEGTTSMKVSSTGAGSENDTVVITTLAAKDLTGHQIIDFWIRWPVTGAVLKVGFGETAITDNEHTITILTADVWQHEYWDISAIATASKDVVDNFGFTLLGTTNTGDGYIDAINAYLGVRIAAGANITIYGDALDASANKVKITAANCIITSGSMAFDDSNSYIDGPLTFEVADADSDLTLTYT